MKTENGKDYYFIVLLSQIALCIFLGITFYLFGAQGQFKHDFLNIINRNINSVELNDAIETFRKHLYTGEVFSVLNIKDESYEKSSLYATADDLNGTGGNDLSLKYATDNSSFSPIFSTVKITPPINVGRYTSYFGYRISPISGDYGFHSGIDIAAPKGTQIRAAFSGKVLKVGMDNTAGNYIYLFHDNGFVTFYCHCEEILVNEDGVIKQGETIALVGSTGYSTGPHLHFEIIKENIKYNPAWLLKV